MSPRMVSHLFPHKLSSSVKETCHCLDTRCEMTEVLKLSFLTPYLEQVSQKTNRKTKKKTDGLPLNVDWWCWYVLSSVRFQTQGLQWHLCQRAKRGWYLLRVPHTLPSRLPGLLWHDYWWRRMDGESVPKYGNILTLFPVTSELFFCFVLFLCTNQQPEPYISIIPSIIFIANLL